MLLLMLLLSLVAMRIAPCDENSFLSCAVSSLHTFRMRWKNKDDKVTFLKASAKTTNKKRRRERKNHAKSKYTRKTNWNKHNQCYHLTLATTWTENRNVAWIRHDSVIICSSLCFHAISPLLIPIPTLILLSSSFFPHPSCSRIPLRILLQRKPNLIQNSVCTWILFRKLSSSEFAGRNLDELSHDLKFNVHTFEIIIWNFHIYFYSEYKTIV